MVKFLLFDLSVCIKAFFYSNCDCWKLMLANYYHHHHHHHRLLIICTKYMIDYPWLIATLFLFSVDKPEFKQGLKNKTVKVGETVVLKCKLKNTDIPPTITWYKDGTVIQPGDAFYKFHLFRHSSRMKIRRIRLEDSGKYTCHVSNFVTNVSTHSWLTVLRQTGNNLKSKKNSFSTLS